jgi:hypothetical protein
LVVPRRPRRADDGHPRGAQPSLALARANALDRDQRLATARAALAAAPDALHKGILSLDGTTVLQVGYLRQRHDRFVVDVFSYRMARDRTASHIAQAPLVIARPALEEALATLAHGPETVVTDVQVALFLTLLTICHHSLGNLDRLLDTRYLLPCCAGFVVGHIAAAALDRAADLGTQADQPLYFRIEPGSAPRSIACYADQHVGLATPELRDIHAALAAYLKTNARLVEMLVQATLLPTGWHDDAILGLFGSPQARATLAALAAIIQSPAYRAITARLPRSDTSSSRHH